MARRFRVTIKILPNLVSVGILPGAGFRVGRSAKALAQIDQENATPEEAVEEKNEAWQQKC